MTTFKQHIRTEFIEGSAISPDLFESAVEFVEDTGRWEVHELLGRKIPRFWQTRPPHDFGVCAVLRNEDGRFSKLKPEHPELDTKYTARKGEGQPVYLPAVPVRIWALIAERYGLELPLEVQQALAEGNLSAVSGRHGMPSLWDWVEHSHCPIQFVEGEKKTLSLLSLGYATIGINGCHGGQYTKDALGNRLPRPIINPPLQRFVGAERQFTVALDQDPKSKPKSRQAVALGLRRLGRVLQDNGAQAANISVAQWDGKNGKGPDDLIVQKGADALHEALNHGLSFEHWQIQQRLLNNLSDSAAVVTDSANLSTLEVEQLPECGIIAISSAKGTGKTKLTAKMTAEKSAVASATHRIALGRNQVERIGLHWRADLDKTPDGRFIAGDGYTLRVGFCVDALLAIEPEHFRGCDLVIDEVVQVVRHLLTSKTCEKEGRRPVLLARFRRLLQAARRVICADADLDNATLHYLCALRGDGKQVFLIRNDYQPEPYPVTFIQASDQTAITGELISHGKRLERGKTLLAMTDSKRQSKILGRAIETLCPGLRVLVINSETSGGPVEREFIQTPDAVLQRHEFDVILCSPSVATGVSIEAQGIVEAVYGLFTGVSSTDADMSQALARVRENVPRVVWCVQHGSNYCRVSRSTHPLELKRHLQDRSTAVVGMTRSNLREDFTGRMENYDWQADPHINLYSHISAAQNYAMQNLRDALLVRLRHEGNQVTVQVCDGDTRYREMLQQARQELRTMDAEALVNADRLNAIEVKALERLEVLTPEQQRAMTRYHFCEFYCLEAEALTVDDILEDKDGRRRAELLNLEAQFYGELAADKSAQSLEKQAQWNQGICPWDINGAILRQQLRDLLGLADFFDINKTWTAEDLEPYAERIREKASFVRSILHLTINDAMSDVQCVHQLLSQLGIKVRFHWQGNSRKKRIKVYFLERERWEFLTGVLTRRRDRRENHGDPGSPLSVMNQNQGGDPSADTSDLSITQGSRVVWKGQQWDCVRLEGSIAVVTDPEDWIKAEYEVPIPELKPPA